MKVLVDLCGSEVVRVYRAWRRVCCRLKKLFIVLNCHTGFSFHLLCRPSARQLKPRKSYLDENGKYRSYEPEPVSVIVRELGIKGWLKGER